jgi:hypothetical protein
MSRTRLSLLAAAALVATTAAAMAAAPALLLHVSTGEWQVTNSMKMSGMENMMAGMNQAELAHLPPASRARIEASMAAMNGAHVNNIKSCVTQKDLERPFRPDMGHDVTCNYDVQKVSFNDEIVHVTCTGKHQMDGTMHMSAPSPTVMTGHMDMSFSEGGHTMHMVDDITGHWLGAACKADDAGYNH